MQQAVPFLSLPARPCPAADRGGARHDRRNEELHEKGGPKASTGRGRHSTKNKEQTEQMIKAAKEKWYPKLPDWKEKRRETTTQQIEKHQMSKTTYGFADVNDI